MAEYKQVRLNPDVRGLLDDYKMNGESYSIAIGRLFKENDALKEDKENLMKIAMNFDLNFLNENEGLRIGLENYEKDKGVSRSYILENLLLKFLYDEGYFKVD